MTAKGPDRLISIDWKDDEGPLERMARKHKEEAEISPGEQCESKYLRKEYVCAVRQVESSFTWEGIGCTTQINEGRCPMLRMTPRSYLYKSVDEENDAILIRWEEVERGYKA